MTELRRPTSGFTKMAWIRDPDVPAGKPADGTYDCPGDGCGAKIGPVAFGARPAPCAVCGTQLDGRGWIEGLGQAPCQDLACREQGCPEHPCHSGGDHTYEQHHSPGDHQGADECRCPVYTPEGGFR